MMASTSCSKASSTDAATETSPLSSTDDVSLTIASASDGSATMPLGVTDSSFLTAGFFAPLLLRLRRLEPLRFLLLDVLALTTLADSCSSTVVSDGFVSVLSVLAVLSASVPVILSFLVLSMAASLATLSSSLFDCVVALLLPDIVSSLIGKLECRDTKSPSFKMRFSLDTSMLMTPISCRTRFVSYA